MGAEPRRTTDSHSRWRKLMYPAPVAPSTLGPGRRARAVEPGGERCCCCCRCRCCRCSCCSCRCCLLRCWINCRSLPLCCCCYIVAMLVIVVSFMLLLALLRCCYSCFAFCCCWSCLISACAAPAPHRAAVARRPARGEAAPPLPRSAGHRPCRYASSSNSSGSQHSSMQQHILGQVQAWSVGGDEVAQGVGRVRPGPRGCWPQPRRSGLRTTR